MSKDSAIAPGSDYFKEILGDKNDGIVIQEKLNEGKTKIIFSIRDPIGNDKAESGRVLIYSKDRITAGDGARAHELKGKASVSNCTTVAVFEYLTALGMKTHFVRARNDRSFVAEQCSMIPIEWVTRRIATGSFLRRNAGVPEGYRFSPPKLEMFFKDDANHDPQWSYEQLVSAGLKAGERTISRADVDYMLGVSELVFQVLERAWAALECTLVDMKIEFGVSARTGEIVLADIIDSDSWRLWPRGDKRLMKDKQVYRDMKEVTSEGLSAVLRNFEWILEQVRQLAQWPAQAERARVVCVLGSGFGRDLEVARVVQHMLDRFHVPCLVRVASAHKSTADVLQAIAEYESDGIPTVFVAIAGRSNGLGPVISGNTCYPVINCPSIATNGPEWAPHDLWSSLRMPSGIACSTVLSPEAAGLQAAQMLALHSPALWGRLRVYRFTQLLQTVREADHKITSAASAP